MPHWTPLSRGCALGYRKGAKSGVWLAKVVQADFRRETTIGPADDIMDADGASILDHTQAQARARDWIAAQLREADGHEAVGDLTVKQALADYMSDYRQRGGKAGADTQKRSDALILPSLGALQVAKLTATKIRNWQSALAEAGARMRTKPGAAQQYRDTKDDPDAPRKRRATANRTLTILKAALNHAFREGRVGNDQAWRRVRPFREADAARVRYLSADECRRLVEACDGPELRSLVQAALLTGCRYGELASLRGADFDLTSGTVHVRFSKAGKPRHVVLNAEGIAFFTDATTDLAGDGLIFARGDGQGWGRSHQSRPLVDACRKAKISPAASFHILRHTYASHLVQAGASLQVVAANLGHADTRMTEKHYAHLAPSHVATIIRATMPTLGILQPSSI